METTKVLTEFLLIGVQAVLWILLIPVVSDSLIENAIAIHPAAEGVEAANGGEGGEAAKSWLVEHASDFAALLTVVILGTCYSLGAVIDAFTALIEDLPKAFWRNETMERRAEESGVLRKHAPEETQRLDEGYKQLRFLRSTVFNLLIIALLALCHDIALTVKGLVWGLGLAAICGWYRRRAGISARRKALLASVCEEHGVTLKTHTS